MPPIRLLTLGQLRLEPSSAHALGGRRKELVLLTYLARRAPRAIPREELAALFWPVPDEARSRHSLRQALHRLRKVIGHGLDIRPTDVRLLDGVLELDATIFERVAANEDARAAVDLWRGDFLIGMEDAGGASYRAWLEAEREALRRRLSWSYDRLSGEAMERAEWTRALEWAERWSAALPHDVRASSRLEEARELAGHIRAAPGSRALAAPAMVGRGAAFSELVRLWHEVRRGTGASLLVEGEAGIGKSRLLEEFLRWCARAGDASVALSASGTASAGAEAWGTAGRLLAGVRAAPGLGGAADAALGELSRIVPTLRERFPGLPSPVGTDAAVAAAARDVLRDVAAEVAVLVALDDASAADAETMRLVAMLAAEPPPGVFVLVLRRPSPADAAGFSGVARLPLQPLTVDEIEQLLASMLPLEERTRGVLAARLRNEGGGNPRLTIELASALAETGAVVPSPDGGWRTTGDAATLQLPLPAGVRDAVRRELAELGAPARAVAEAAAVLGDECVPSWLESMLVAAPATFADSIAQLGERGMVRVTEGGPLRYAFAHPIVRRAVYEQLTPRRRQALHRAAAQAIEPDAERRSDARALLAWHQSNAGPARRSRWAAATAAVVAVVVAATMAGAPWRWSAQAPAPSSATTLAVLPFALQGSAELSYLREGIPTLLGAGLSGSAGVRIVDPNVLLAAAGRDESSVRDPDRGRALALRFGAGMYVLGTITAAGGQIQVSASLYDARDGLRGTAHATAASESDVFALADRLARELLSSLPQGAGDRFPDVAATTTTSLGALQAYLAGERALRAGRFGEAANALGRALDEDSTFALAAYRKAVAAEWLKDPAMEAQSIHQAMRHRERLPARDRMLVEAYEAGHRGSADEAERLFRAVLRTHPSDPVAWERLGELLIHYNPLRGRPMNEARHAFEQAYTLDPGDAEPLWHLAQLAAMRRDQTALDSLAGRFGTGWEGAIVRLMAARLRGDAGAAARARAELRASPEDMLYVAAQAVSLFSGDLDEGARLAALLSQPGRPARWRAAGRIVEAHARLAAGQWAAARDALQSGEALDPGSSLPYQAAFAALPFLPAAPGAHAALLAELEAWDVASPVRSAIQHPYVDAHDGIRAELRGYLLGVLRARAGDGVGASRVVAALEESEAVPGDDARLRHDFALAIRAQSALHAGRVADALRFLERAHMAPEAVVVSLSPFHSLAYERFMRAELLRILGRNDDALRWYASVAESPPFGYIFRAAAHFQSGDILERTGRRAEAAEHFAHFIQLWKDCDEELRPLLSEAMQRLDRLR